MAPSPTWRQQLTQRPQLLVVGGVLLLAGLAAAIHFAMAAESARRQEAERAQALQLRLETRLKLDAIARQQEELLAQEKNKQALARRDTTTFQQAALEADIASQDRDLRIQRRTALERQRAQLQKEQQRRRTELQALMKEEVQGRIEQEESEACLTAFSKYEASKRDPATEPEKIAADIAAVKQLCRT